jgi:hypothetical protein
MKSYRRLALAAAAATMSVLALSACGSSSAGDAATMGSTGIPDDWLRDEVEAVLVAKGQPSNASDPSLVQQTLGRMITMELVDQVSEQEGVVVTEGQIDEFLANYESQLGGRDAVEQQLIQQNIAPPMIRSIVRLQMQAQALGIALDPRGSAEEQGQAVFDAVVAKSDELDTTVNPRYGTWDANQLQVGPIPNDLSSPPTLG